MSHDASGTVHRRTSPFGERTIAVLFCGVALAVQLGWLAALAYGALHLAAALS